MIALKIIALPSILFEEAKTSGLIVAMILFAFDFLILFLYLKIKEKYPELSLYELIQRFLGKVVAKIIYLLIFIFFICKLSMLMNESVSYMQAIVDEHYNLLLLLITFLPVISTLVFSGLKSSARTCEFGFVFIVIGLIVCIFASEISNTLGELGPILERPKQILSSVFDMSFWFSDFLFIAVLADKIKIEKNMKRRVFGFAIFACFMVMFLYFIYFRLFRITAFLHKNAIADVTQYNRNIGNSGNIDIISILLYMIIIFFQGSLYMHCLKTVYEKIVGYKNSVHSLIVLNLIIVFVQFFLLFNLERVVNLSTSYLKYLNLLAFLVVPIFYICLLIFDKEKKNAGKIKEICKKN